MSGVLVPRPKTTMILQVDDLDLLMGEVAACGHASEVIELLERRLVPVEPDDFQRVKQEGGMGSWRCNTCGTDCRADGPGCEGSDYDFTPSYWPDDEGDYMLVPCAGIGGDGCVDPTCPCQDGDET